MLLPALPDDIYVSIFQHLALAELLLLRRVECVQHMSFAV